MRRGGWLATGLAVASLVALGLVLVRYWPNTPESTSGQATSKLTRLAAAERANPIDLAGTTLRHEPLDVSDWRGDVVVVNVWGSWCAPCREEAPDLARVHDATRGKDVQFVGIDVRDQVAAARAFARSYGIEYPSLYDTDGSRLLTFKGSIPVNAIPSTLVLDRKGRLAATVVGVVDDTTLNGLIADLLTENRHDA